MKKLKKLAVASFVACTVVASAGAMATQHLEVPASSLLLQTYGGTAVTLYYTGSACASGQLTLDPSDSSDRNKLLWATVLSAKASNLKVNFDYDIGTNVCYIRAFAVMPTT